MNALNLVLAALALVPQPRNVVELGGETANTAKTFRVDASDPNLVLITYGGTVTTLQRVDPSGGQPAAAYYMAKKDIPLSKSSTILLNNTMHYMITLIVMPLKKFRDAGV